MHQRFLAAEWEVRFAAVVGLQAGHAQGGGWGVAVGAGGGTEGPGNASGAARVVGDGLLAGGIGDGAEAAEVDAFYWAAHGWEEGWLGGVRGGFGHWMASWGSLGLGAAVAG